MSAVLALFGHHLPQLSEGGQRTRSTLPYKTWEERQDLDAILVGTTPKATRAHIGIVIGDQVLHHCPEVGQPVIEQYEDLVQAKRYPHVLGLITPLETP